METKVFNKELKLIDFQNMLDTNLSPEARNFISNQNFKYRDISSKEENDAYIEYLNFLFSNKQPSGPEYKVKWDFGWKENLDSYLLTGKISDLIPKFVKSNKLIRLNGRWILPESSDFESNFVFIIRDYLFKKYFIDFNHIFEFGCGTGLNLVHLSNIFPAKQLVGFDWSESSVDILNELNKKHQNIQGQLFNMFEPNTLNDVWNKSNSAILTIGAMEQLGSSYTRFLNFILESRTKIIVNIETMFELYEDENLFDFLPQQYIKKRNWLQGYYAKLYEFELQGKLKILEVKKTFGSFYHDGYTIVVWENLSV